MHRRDEREGERGLALVSVLWAISILTLIAATILTSSTLSRRLENNARRELQARVLADAAINRTVLALLDHRAEKRWRIDGVPQVFEFDGTPIRVSIEDELGKIDLNVANDVLIRGLFRAAGLGSGAADVLADRVLDWRSLSGLKSLDGADRSDYERERLAYRPRGGAFQSVDELRLVMGMTPELFEKLVSAVTVHSKRPTIDPSTASRLALLALPGMDEGRADDLIAARSRKAQAGNTLPTGVLDPSISLGGRAFAVRVEIGRDGLSYEQRAVIELTGDPQRPYMVLAWN